MLSSSTFSTAQYLDALPTSLHQARTKTISIAIKRGIKYQFPPQEISSGFVRNLFAELNSQTFLAFLEELTGIEGLIPDPHFDGGLHETKRGGHLGIHADFNIHGRLNLERRLNLLFYLNDDWDAEFGGDLERWDNQMTECSVKVQPCFGRAVVFSTLSWAPRPA